jgi:RNA polymerase sigma-70 factor, ECF subfamily
VCPVTPDSAPKLNQSDLQLVARAVRGEREALAEVDRRLLAASRAVLARWDRPPIEIEELTQRLRERLLVKVGSKAPRLSDYSGKGTLGKWMQAIAASMTVDAHRASATAEASKAEEEDAVLVAAAGAGADVELGDAGTKRAFTQAFKAALTQISARDRTVMRLRYVEQSSLDAIGTLYKVHRTTVMRWLEDAHREVLAKTRQQLKHELGLKVRELDSLIQNVDLSFIERVSRLLRAPGSDAK